MIRDFKSILLAMLMTTLVIATGCQNDKPRLADEEVLEVDDNDEVDDKANSDESEDSNAIEPDE